MTTTIASLLVSRSSLAIPLSALDLTVSPYRVGGEHQTLDFQPVVPEYQWAKSPYQDGAALVGVTLALVDACVVDVDITGADQAAIDTSLSALIAAFSQYTYTVEAVLDAKHYKWTCWMASYAPGLTAPSNIYGQVLPVRLVFPRSPVPVTGPY